MTLTPGHAVRERVRVPADLSDINIGCKSARCHPLVLHSSFLRAFIDMSDHCVTLSAASSLLDGSHDRLSAPGPDVRFPPARSDANVHDSITKGGVYPVDAATPVSELIYSVVAPCLIRYPSDLLGRVGRPPMRGDWSTPPGSP